MDSRYARVTRGIVFSRTAVGLHRSYLAANPTYTTQTSALQSGNRAADPCRSVVFLFPFSFSLLPPIFPLFPDFSIQINSLRSIFPCFTHLGTALAKTLLSANLPKI